VHYSRLDPQTTVGGVETFARNLSLIFEKVVYMTPQNRDEGFVRRDKLPVICDNHMVMDWPRDMTVIGFQHGVAWRKVFSTRSRFDLELAVRQVQATRRRNVLWVACARWIADSFNALTRCPSRTVIYHPTDVHRFDGELSNAGSRLILHDARTAHKGRELVAHIMREIAEYAFEPLSCTSEEMPERMRGALAFLHLSRYEGNSLVCNEAMAMNLPCLFTRVGLMLDPGPRPDVAVIDTRTAYSKPAQLVEKVRAFLAEAHRRPFRPRDWVVEHASIEVAREGWAKVMAEFDTTAFAS
jgi:glycosyltransferase involved in cell wall biosynthesis